MKFPRLADAHHLLSSIHRIKTIHDLRIHSFVVCHLAVGCFSCCCSMRYSGVMVVVVGANAGHNHNSKIHFAVNELSISIWKATAMAVAATSRTKNTSWNNIDERWVVYTPENKTLKVKQRGPYIVRAHSCETLRISFTHHSHLWVFIGFK